MIPEIPKRSRSPRNRVQELLCETAFCWLPLLAGLNLLSYSLVRLGIGKGVNTLEVQRT